MPVTVHIDDNGVKYNAIGSGEWYGAEGSQLRSQGWSYCGFGTWGIYITPPGVPCFPKVGPNIQPPAPPGEPTTTPTGQPILVRDTACGTCRKPNITPIATDTGGGVTTRPGTREVVLKKQGLPWWVILLAILLATKVVSDE